MIPPIATRICSPLLGSGRTTKDLSRKRERSERAKFRTNTKTRRTQRRHMEAKKPVRSSCCLAFLKHFAHSTYSSCSLCLRVRPLSVRPFAVFALSRQKESRPSRITVLRAPILFFVFVRDFCAKTVEFSASHGSRLARIPP